MHTIFSYHVFLKEVYSVNTEIWMVSYGVLAARLFDNTTNAAALQLILIVWEIAAAILKIWFVLHNHTLHWNEFAIHLPSFIWWCFLIETEYSVIGRMDFTLQQHKVTLTLINDLKSDSVLIKPLPNLRIRCGGGLNGYESISRGNLKSHVENNLCKVVSLSYLHRNLFRACFKKYADYL